MPEDDSYTLKRILKHGAPTKLLDALLIDFSRLGDYSAAKLLLQGGANSNAVDDVQGSSVHYAVERGSLELVKLLAYYGANLSAVAVDGTTPVSLAVIKNNVPILKFLVHHGAAHDIADYTGKIPHMHAAQHANRAEFLQVLDQAPRRPSGDVTSAPSANTL